MATGTVKWFSVVKKYGFIIPDEGEREVFVHLSTLASAGIPHIDDGTRVSFDLEATMTRVFAVNLAVLAPAAADRPAGAEHRGDALPL